METMCQDFLERMNTPADGLTLEEVKARNEVHGKLTSCSYNASSQGMAFNSNTLLSIGAPGVPNSAIASFAALAAIAGLPAGIMGMYVSVNILVDAGATCCNVLGDIASSVAMKRTCKLPGHEP